MKTEKKSFKKILAASKAQSIAFVAEGLPVTADGYLLTETDMDNVEAALEAGETAAANLATSQSQLQTANSDKVKLEGDLKTANDKIEKLEKRDGVTASTPAAEGDPKHVQEVDANDMAFQKELYAKI